MKVNERATVDGSNGEFSTIPRESSKSDNLHGPPMCGVRPLASNGVTGMDPNVAVTASPIRRDHGQATGILVLKEAKDLKHSANRLKVCLR